jgi:hypothetical protein
MAENKEWWWAKTKAEYLSGMHGLLGLSQRFIVEQEAYWVSKFAGAEINLPPIPKQLDSIRYRAVTRGLMFVPHFVPTPELSEIQVSEAQRGSFVPLPVDQWKDKNYGLKENGYWVLVENITAHQASEGWGFYADTSILGLYLAHLRSSGKIVNSNEWPSNPVFPTSRFGVSESNFRQYVAPFVAQLLGIDLEQIRLPWAKEYHYLGKNFYSEWGKFSYSEWVNDSTNLPKVSLTLGGYADGLDSVEAAPSGMNACLVGFRMVVQESDTLKQIELEEGEVYALADHLFDDKGLKPLSSK